MTTNQPPISIVMPIFNHPDFVIEMMDSIRNNTFTDWELWAIDDGSSEEAFFAIETYCAQDDRIHYLRRDRDPKGAPTCRNIGLDKAQGKYVIFFDSDDWITTTCLQHRFEEMESRLDVDFMVFPAGIYKDGCPSVEPHSGLYGYPIYKDDVSAFCSRNLPFVVWNNIYRRESLLKAQVKWNEGLRSLQDQAFNLLALTSGLKYAYAKVDADYAYRISNSNSVSKHIGNQSHYDSNALATELAYQTVQAKYGHRYDRDLYLGALYVYNWVARETLSKAFMQQMIEVVRRYSPGYGRLFAFQMWLTRLLSHLLPYRLARQLPTPLSLLRFRYMEQHWIPKRIARCLRS